MQGNFEFSSEPHAAPVKMASKPKYREDSGEENAPLNLMSDPRVFRGSTYSAQVMTQGSKKDVVSSKTVKSGLKLMRGTRGKFQGRRGVSPPPVDGRVHMNIQTDDFLEELTDRPIEIDATTQTLAELNRPSSPLFVPAKVGKDVETQIVQGDLFNFDAEVEPVLELLVGKTIHVSMLELMQEEELAAIRKQQSEYEALKNVELSEVQRMESEARRKQDEKSRRLHQERKRIEDRRELEEKVAARAFARQYLGGLHSDLFDELEGEGFFFDPVRREVENIFMKGVIDRLNTSAGAYDAAQKLMDDLIKASKKTQKIFETEVLKLRKELADRLAAEEAARQKALEEEVARLKAEEEAKLATEFAAEGEAEE
jgi:hypothetical protein